MGASYRVYFRGRRDDIVGRQDFEAEDDGVALELAETLCNACSDLVGEVEVWQGVRRIDRARPAPPSAEIVAGQRQEHIVALEEQLRDSRWAVSRSRRLLQRLGESMAKSREAG